MFRNKKPDIKQYAIIGIILTSVIAALSQCTKINENVIWDIFDEVQRKYFPQTIINDFIIKDPDRLDRRVKRDVDKAIRDYEYLTGDDGTVRIPSPRYSERPVDASVCYTPECRALGGEIRLCAPWVLDCPPEGVVK